MNPAALQIVAGAVLFGLIPLFVSSCAGMPLAGIALGRALFAALTGALMMLMMRQSFRFAIRLLPHYLLWTFFLAAAILFYFLAIRAAGQALPGAVLGIHPVFVVLFVRLFFGEKIRFRTLAACLAAIAGVLLLAGPLQGNSSMLSGIVYSLLSALMLGLNFTYHLRFLKDEPPVRLMFFQNLFQLPFLSVFLFAEGGSFSVSFIFPLMMLGVFCTGIAYLLIYKGSQHVSKQQIGLLQVIENIIPVFTGLFFFGEHLSLTAVAGIICILSSTLLAALGHAPEETQPARS